MKSIYLSDGRSGATFIYENMIKEETQILYLFKGAYTLQDLENMTEYEVMLIQEAYKDIKETERILFERAKENQGKQQIVNNITLPNSRFNLPKEDKEKSGD